MSSLYHQRSLRIALGNWHCARGDFRLELVVRGHLLSWIVKKALDSAQGRAELAGGAFVVVARRDAAANLPTGAA